MKRKIGILGGSFDPVHHAHLQLAKESMLQAGLDQVLFLPVYHPPHKETKNMTPFEDRVHMLRLAVEPYPAFRVSLIEKEIEPPAYTAKTLRLLQEKLPDAEFYYIVGDDSLDYMTMWYQPEEIFRLSEVLVIQRELKDEELNRSMEDLRKDYGARIRLLKTPVLPYRASSFRKDLMEGKEGDQRAVPASVMEYIRSHHLYGYMEDDMGKKKSEEEKKEGLFYGSLALRILDDLKKNQTEARFKHIMGVCCTASSLAMCYGESPKRALLAALLHDSAKHFKPDELLRRCKKAGIPIRPAEEKNPSLLHAAYGAYLGSHRYDIEDEGILDAVRYHTTGHPDMDLFAKILYVADYIEPGRRKLPKLEELRQLAFRDLDLSLYIILEESIEYLKAKNMEFDPRTLDTYTAMKRKIEERDKK